MTNNNMSSSITGIVQQQLDDIAGANHTGAGTISARFEGMDLRSRLISVGRLGCEFESLEIVRQPMQTSSTDALRKIADRLAEQLSYLEERLVVLEIDDVTPHVQLRSDAPRQVDAARSYFELTVNPQGLTLRRFRKQAGNRREAVAATLTRDVFCRVCVDMAAAISN